MQLKDIKQVSTKSKLNLSVGNVAPSELTRDARMDVVFVEIEKLVPYQFQARKIFDQEELEILAHSISSYGMRSPITVERDKDNPNTFRILSGERRWRAAKILNLKIVPCIINENNTISEEIALIENIQRKDLTPIELLKGIETYITNHPNMLKEEVIKKLGISKAHFYRIIGLSKLSEDARHLAMKTSVPIDKLVMVAKADQEQQMVLLNRLISKMEAQVIKNRAENILEKARSRSNQVLEINLQKDQIEVATNFMLLSKRNRMDVVSLLKRMISELEGEGDESDF